MVTSTATGKTGTYLVIEFTFKANEDGKIKVTNEFKEKNTKVFAELLDGAEIPVEDDETLESFESGETAEAPESSEEAPEPAETEETEPVETEDNTDNNDDNADNNSGSTDTNTDNSNPGGIPVD